MTVDTLTEAELIVETMSIELVTPDPDNPRDTLGELGELTDSIEANGIYQPLIVTPTGVLGGDDREIVMVVAGHRRLAAAKLAELTHVPVIVRADIDEQGRRSAQFVENFHRLDLGPIEKARALKQLADAGVMQKDIASTVGVTQPTVSKLLALLKLPDKAQGWVAVGKMTQEDAVALAALPAPKVKELTTDGPPPDWRIRNAKQHVEQDKARAAAEKEVQAKGWKILDEDPDHYQQLGLEGDDKAVALEVDRHSPRGLLAHVDPAEHEKADCHAVYIRPNGAVVPACTTPGLHPKPKSWKSPMELEQIEAAKTGKTENGRKLAQWEIDRAKRFEARDRVEALLAPTRAACVKLLQADVDPKVVADYAMTAILSADEIDPSGASDLLGIQEKGWRADELVKAIGGEGHIDGLAALHAWGLSEGLTALETVTEDLLVDPESTTDEDSAAARRLLDHLSGLEWDDMPTFDEFVAAATGASAAATGDDEQPTITVEVYKLRGKYKRRCSDCGDLDGQNTEEKLANDRATQHLFEKHGIEDAA